MGTRQRLVIVGGGMAGFGLCDRLVRGGAIDRFEVTIIGEEPQPAYDRVNLSKLFAGRSAEQLLLASAKWYDDHSVTLRTGCRVVGINRQKKTIQDNHAREYPYDQLVLATGSHAFVPPVPGVEHAGVFVYRTISDLQAIEVHCRDRSAKLGAVIGGGLLGLEAAKVLMDLGLRVSVIEMAPGLMPRQLDAEAAKLLKQMIETMGVDIHLVRRTNEIQSQPDGKLRLCFDNAEALNIDVLIVAAGVRPNDSLAKDAGLEVGRRGGIVVDEHLQTSDPDIYAIGECACYQQHVFGLAAPCFRMADVLAKRLGGQTDLFEGADESAELKLLGIQVATLGREIGQSPGGRVITHHHAGGYRKLLVERGRVVGASCVGDWAELAQIRQAVNKQTRLWSWQDRRFRRTGSPWSPGGPMSIAQWPSDAIVCSCLSIPKSQISQCIADGATDVSQIATACGASTACGSCRDLLSELVGQPTEPSNAAGPVVMRVTSVLAILAGAVWVLAPPVAMANSVQSFWRNIDVLWRSDLARQMTGFTLLGLTLLGMIFSLRKRWAWFRWGSYGFWRVAHGILGTTVMVAVAVHTGLRLGENLNLLLGVCFLCAAVLGGIAGIASSLESRVLGNAAIRIRRMRPKLTRIHLWVTWPLPVLIALHILSFYWFSD